MKIKLAIVVPNKIREIPRIVSYNDLLQMPPFQGTFMNKESNGIRVQSDEIRFADIQKIYITLN